MSTKKFAASAKAKWDRCHRIEAGSVPSALYTDENPATTIKGMGYRNASVAERTIRLTSQPGVRYKQYWTIRAMRERAAHHPHPTADTNEAVRVFDSWLENYRPPLAEERAARENEWKRFRSLCASEANAHSYCKRPSVEDIRRARDDNRIGREILVRLLSKSNIKRQGAVNVAFPITAWTALFGAPGFHGYGRHDIIESNTSKVRIDGCIGLGEVVGIGKASSALGPAALELLTRIYVQYDRDQEVVTETFYNRQRQSHATLSAFWGGAGTSDPKGGIGRASTDDAITTERDKEETEDDCAPTRNSEEPSWCCRACTFAHAGESKRNFLSCELCGTDRTNETDAHNTITHETSVALFTPSSDRERRGTSDGTACALRQRWGLLRAPTCDDIRPRKQRRKALDALPPIMGHVVVLDFEWTADDKRKMEPVAEITQFPSVCMKLLGGRAAASSFGFSEASSFANDDRIPHDLKPSPSKQNDAVCVSVFDSFVRPTLNPTLTQFSIDLTAITQDMVNEAPVLDAVLDRYMKWLQSLGLVDKQGNRNGNWAFVTWGDSDIMSTLRLELRYKGIDLPPCFDRWINLKHKSVFKQHYRREARGGLRRCVESVGAKWEGRAHNGLVDSINTAKIVKHMVQTGFRFTRSTRGLDRTGTPFGQQSSSKKEY